MADENPEELAAMAAAYKAWGVSIPDDDVYGDPRYLFKSAAMAMWNAGVQYGFDKADFAEFEPRRENVVTAIIQDLSDMPQDDAEDDDAYIVTYDHLLIVLRRHICGEE